MNCFQDWEKKTFIEIGLLNGGYLLMWRNYFGSKVRIIEIDLNPSAKELQSYGYKFI